MKKNAKKGLQKGRGSRNTLKIEDIEAVFAERKPGGVLSLSGFLDCISDDLSSAADAFSAGVCVHAQRG